MKLMSVVVVVVVLLGSVLVSPSIEGGGDGEEMIVVPCDEFPKFFPCGFPLRLSVFEREDLDEGELFSRIFGKDLLGEFPELGLEEIERVVRELLVVDEPTVAGVRDKVDGLADDITGLLGDINVYAGEEPTDPEQDVIDLLEAIIAKLNDVVDHLADEDTWGSIGEIEEFVIGWLNEVVDKVGELVDDKPDPDLLAVLNALLDVHSPLPHEQTIVVILGELYSVHIGGLPDVPSVGEVFELLEAVFRQAEHVVENIDRYTEHLLSLDVPDFCETQDVFVTDEIPKHPILVLSTFDANWPFVERTWINAVDTFYEEACFLLEVLVGYWTPHWGPRIKDFIDEDPFNHGHGYPWVLDHQIPDDRITTHMFAFVNCFFKHQLWVGDENHPSDPTTGHAFAQSVLFTGDWATYRWTRVWTQDGGMGGINMDGRATRGAEASWVRGFDQNLTETDPDGWPDPNVQEQTFDFCLDALRWDLPDITHNWVLAMSWQRDRVFAHEIGHGMGLHRNFNSIGGFSGTNWNQATGITHGGECDMDGPFHAHAQLLVTYTPDSLNVGCPVYGTCDGCFHWHTYEDEYGDEHQSGLGQLLDDVSRAEAYHTAWHWATQNSNQNLGPQPREPPILDPSQWRIGGHFTIEDTLAHYWYVDDVAQLLYRDSLHIQKDEVVKIEPLLGRFGDEMVRIV